MIGSVIYTGEISPSMGGGGKGGVNSLPLKGREAPKKRRVRAALAQKERNTCFPGESEGGA